MPGINCGILRFSVDVLVFFDLPQGDVSKCLFTPRRVPRTDQRSRSSQVQFNEPLSVFRAPRMGEELLT